MAVAGESKLSMEEEVDLPLDLLRKRQTAQVIALTCAEAR
jgi:hypothetical protein